VRERGRREEGMREEVEVYETGIMAP